MTFTNKEIEEILMRVTVMVQGFNQVTELTNCRTCGKECKHRPANDQIMRFNCFDWEGVKNEQNGNH